MGKQLATFHLALGCVYVSEVWNNNKRDKEDLYDFMIALNWDTWWTFSYVPKRIKYNNLANTDILTRNMQATKAI